MLKLAFFSFIMRLAYEADPSVLRGPDIYKVPRNLTKVQSLISFHSLHFCFKS
jgi:hypothetical protein